MRKKTDQIAQGRDNFQTPKLSLDDKQHPLLKGKVCNVPNVRQIAMATLSLRKRRKIAANSRGNSTSESSQVIHNVHHLNLGCHSTCGYLLLLLLLLLLFLPQNKFNLSMPGHFQRLYKSTHWCMGPVFFFVSILWCSSQSGDQSGKLFSQIWLHTRDMKVKTITESFHILHYALELILKNLANWIFLAWNLVHFFPWKILDWLLPYVTFEHKFPHVPVPRAILCGNQNWLN